MKIIQPQREYTHSYYLTAARCNAQSELSVAKLAQQVIETATTHANNLGVGYERLIRDGYAWVLSRLTFEMARYPHMHEHYTLTTWIEGFNRHFSERNFVVTSESGETLGHVRSVWVAIDIASRRPANLDGITNLADSISSRKCPIAPQSKLHPVSSPSTTCRYIFDASDIDFNRHVNTVRYIELMTNSMPLQTYDSHYISRFEIAFSHEAHYGEEAAIKAAHTTDSTDPITVHTEIYDSGKTFCIAKFLLKTR
jgi:acyl-ACP thioesterase